MPGIESLVKKEYQPTVAVIAVGIAMVVTMIYGIANAETWVTTKAQAVTEASVKGIDQKNESMHALMNVTILDHADRLKKLEASQSEQHDLLIGIKDDVKYLRSDADRRHK
jgi:Asp-tRNA(Asn)/Glu-tRNA(Gln) amidotransferase A subunit family amidase